MTFSGFLKEMLSEVGSNGTSYISSKRVVGLLLVTVSLICIIYLTIKEGGTVIVENLIQTSLVMGASLLGISSVTSIWKNGSISVGGEKNINSQPSQSSLQCPYHNTKEGS